MKIDGKNKVLNIADCRPTQAACDSAPPQGERRAFLPNQPELIVGQFDFVVSENSLYNHVMVKTVKAFSELLEQLQELLPKLQDQYHIQSMEVFGSYVRGEEREDSDFDLLVLFDEAPTLFKFVELENSLSDHLGVKVDLVMKDSLKPTIGKRILEEAYPV